MRIGFVGLGRMGANMVRRLIRDGHEVVAYNRTPEKTKEIEGEGAIGAYSIAELVEKLDKPRAVWIMSRLATRPKPRSPSCSSTSNRATRSSTAATRTSTTTSAVTASSPRRESSTSTRAPRAGSGVSRSAIA